MAQPHDPPFETDLPDLSDAGRRSVARYEQALANPVPGQSPAIESFLDDVPETERERLRAVLEQMTSQATRLTPPETARRCRHLKISKDGHALARRHSHRHVWGGLLSLKAWSR